MCGFVDQPPVNLDVMTKLREKTIEQLRAVLRLGTSDPSPDIDQQQPAQDVVPGDKPEGDNPIDVLAKSIEIEILKLCGKTNNPISTIQLPACRRRKFRIQEQIPVAVFQSQRHPQLGAPRQSHQGGCLTRAAGFHVS